MSPCVHSLLLPPSFLFTSLPRLTPADNPSGDKYPSGTPAQPQMTQHHLALTGRWCKKQKTLVIFMSYCELIIHWDPLVKAHLLQTCGFRFLFFIQATFFQMKCSCCFSSSHSVSLRELQHQLFFSPYVKKSQEKKPPSVLAREVGIIIQNNNKRVSKHPEIKSCSQLNKCRQN